MTERSEGMSGARAPASRTTMGTGGAAPEQEMSIAMRTGAGAARGAEADSLRWQASYG
jgi:hypothetical protein